MPRIPSYRHHKASGQAVVRLNGKDFYLGPFGTRVSRNEYDRITGEWLSGGRRLANQSNGPELTVVELLDAWLQHESQSPMPRCTEYRAKRAIDRLQRLYGRHPVSEFGPVALRAMRQTWIDDDLARSTINDYTRIVRGIFRWGVAAELAPPDLHHRLSAVEPLRRGRSAAREGEKKTPVPRSDIRKVRKYLSKPVRALIDLQLLTAARSGEICNLRGVDIDRSADVWTHCPQEHKTAYRGHRRVIYFGPHAQRILNLFLADREPHDYLFSPGQAVRERKQVGAKGRRRPDQPTSSRKTNRKLRPHYARDTYARAIRRACLQAGVEHWHPHRLRHNAATDIRKRFGFEMAQIIAGHQVGSNVTELYAEANHSAAASAVAEFG